MTSPNPARDEAVAPDVLAKQVADAASDMCEIARIVGEWRHGPKQSLTAVREIRACLAAKPPASGRVDAVDKPCPFCGGTNTIQGGDDKVCGIFCKDCGAAGPNGYQSQLQWNDRASLSPAVTSGSEADGEALKPFSRLLSAIEAAWGDRVTDEALLHKVHPSPWLTVGDLRRLAALAKPAASPAGGDVREAFETCAAICEARAEYFDRAPSYREWTDAARSYRATAKEIRERAALSPSTSAAEPVACACLVPKPFDAHEPERRCIICEGYATPPAPAAVDGQRVKR